MLRDTAACQNNYRRFVERAANACEAWILSGSSGAGFCESNEHDGVDVILFFSDAAYARRSQQVSFPDYQPERVDLSGLLYRWLPGMSQDGVLAGSNWTGDLVGLEIDPFDLREDLESRLRAEQQEFYSEKYRQSMSNNDSESA